MKERIMNLCKKCLDTIRNGYGVEILGKCQQKEKCDFCGYPQMWGWKVKVFSKRDE